MVDAAPGGRQQIFIELPVPDYKHFMGLCLVHNGPTTVNEKAALVVARAAAGSVQVRAGRENSFCAARVCTSHFHIGQQWLVPWSGRNELL